MTIQSAKVSLCAPGRASYRHGANHRGDVQAAGVSIRGAAEDSSLEIRELLIQMLQRRFKHFTTPRMTGRCKLSHNPGARQFQALSFAAEAALLFGQAGGSALRPRGR